MAITRRFKRRTNFRRSKDQLHVSCKAFEAVRLPVAAATAAFLFLLHVTASLVVPVLRPPLWLGLDLSTQSLTAAVLSGSDPGRNTPILVERVSFDDDLTSAQQYGALHGMIVRGDAGSERVTAPVFMWLHAFDTLLDRLLTREAEGSGRSGDGNGGGSDGGRDEGGESSAFCFADVRAVSVSAQQHGTVYWRRGAAEALERLRAGSIARAGAAIGANGDKSQHVSMANALSGCFSLEESPIWADSSTQSYADALERAVGGAAALAAATGSRAYLRQGAVQIARVAAEAPAAYHETERISLVCAFLSSVLAGRHTPADASDGTGMNLADFRFTSAELGVFGVLCVHYERCAPVFAVLPIEVRFFYILDRIEDKSEATVSVLDGGCCQR
ncbi:unnamed protein product [Phaeothamnion confervicola]